MLAMAVGDGNELIQHFCFLDFDEYDNVHGELQEFALGLLADFGVHAVAPDVGNIPVRQQPFFGSRTGEAMRKGTLIVVDHAETCNQR